MDFKTLFLVLVSVFLIQALALWQTWRQNRSEIGIRDWAVAAMLLSINSLFSGLSHYISPESEVSLPGSPGALLNEAGNTIGASGWFMAWIGIRHFYHKPTFGYRWVALFALIYVGVNLPSHLLTLSDSWRIGWVSSAFAFFGAMIALEFLNKGWHRNPTVIFVIGIMVFTTTIWGLRALHHITGGATAGVAGTFDILAVYTAIMSSVSMTVGMIMLTNERINGKLTELALYDPLTGAMNRRAFFESSKPFMADLQRSDTDLSICLIDLDHFKKVNDTYGHAVGDLVLKQFAELAPQTLREGDLFARFGGEEFVLLLRNCTEQQALQILNRLRTLTLNREVALEDESLAITFSSGVCHVKGPLKVDLDKLLEWADDALYAAKEAGRDRFIVADIAVEYTKPSG